MKFKEIVRKEKIKKQIDKNYEYIIDHFEELCGSYVNMWVAVDEARVQLANYHLQPLMRTFFVGERLNPTMLFVYCAMVGSGDKPFVVMNYDK